MICTTSSLAGISIICLALFLALSPSHANGAVEDNPGSVQKSLKSKQASLYIENDLVAQYLGLAPTDKWYTSGVKLTFTFDENTAFAPSRWMKNSVDAAISAIRQCGSFDDARYGFVMGQLMYTPGDILTARAQPDDRFYGGWLYMGGVIQKHDGAGTRTAELDIGVVGPNSGAEWAQKFIHRLRHIEAPAGWDNQIKTEPGIQLSYNKIDRFFDKPAQADASFYYGATAGTIFDIARVGIIFRSGDISRDVPASVIESPVVGDRLERRGWYFLGRGEMQVVLHNTFIDGSLFRDAPFSSNIKSKPLIGQMTIGFVKEGFFDLPARLSFLVSRRTSEFTSPVLGKGPLFTFGTINLELPVGD